MKSDFAVALQENAAPRPPGPDTVPQDQSVSVLSPSGLVSILIPCCGQLEYTKLCVPSLLRHSRKPFELIFIDIGSLDGTREYLAGIATAATQIRVETVRTPTDLGIADAIQDAVKLTRGEFIVLLNNDTIVSEGWLHQMVALAQFTPAIGLVGPMSNYADAPQLIEDVPYRIGSRKGLDAAAGSEGLVDTRGLDEFAKKRREDYRSKWQEAERLGGFCLLIKREVLKRIGHLKESTEDLGLLDTNLLCSKARHVGFTLGCCLDLFIHHFGTRTFAHGAPATETSKPRT